MNTCRSFLKLSAAVTVILVTLLLSGCSEIIEYIDNYTPPAKNPDVTQSTAPSDPGETTAPEETQPPQEMLVGVVTNASVLNVRGGPGTEYDIVGKLEEGTKVAIYEQQMVGNTPWGRIKSGWISMDYIVLSNSEEKESSSPDTFLGTVTSENLNIRSGPGTNYGIVGNLGPGDKIQITEIYAKGDKLWGKTIKGWVSMSYVQMDGTTAGTLKISGITTARELTIRAGAGVDKEAIGTYKYGAKVIITALKSVGHQPWGKTDLGWICVDYFDPDGNIIISAG